MGDSTTYRVMGSGMVTLKMTSGMTVTLIEVLHVPNIRNNSVSGSMLIKNGFKMTLSTDKTVIYKDDMYVGRGYLTEG